MCIESIASLTNFSKEVDRFQVMDFCNRLVHFFLFFFFFFWSNCQQLCTAFHILRLCFNVIHIYAVVLSSSFYKLFQWILWLYAQYFMWYICIYRTGKNIILETKTSQKWRVQFFRFKPRFWKKKKKKMRFEIELDIISPASILHTIDQEMVWAHARLLMNFQARFYL